MSTSALISADSLAALLQAGGARPLLADCRYALNDPAAGRQEYAQGHLPGAVHADLGTLMSSPGRADGVGGRHPLPDPQAFADGMAGLGANDDTLVVAYDAGEGVFAARLWWLLRWIGHDKVCVLDGGLQAWREAGGSLDAKTPQPRRGTLRTSLLAQQTLSYEQVLDNLGTAARIVLDARGADRYRGENETMDPVGGRIPGARNRPYKDNLDVNGRFKPAAQLRDEFQAVLAGTPAAHIIHQCGSGVSACHNLLAMSVAGLEGGALYPGSWSEWCRRPDAPVARG